MLAVANKSESGRELKATKWKFMIKVQLQKIYKKRGKLLDY